MIYTFILSKDAVNDIESAYTWYEQQNKGLGNKIISSVESAFTSIQFNPQLYGFRRKNVRGCIVKGFPYLVLFYIVSNRIHVKAVFHTSKNNSIDIVTTISEAGDCPTFILLTVYYGITGNKNSAYY